MAELEEKLREAACFGDIDGVKELLAHGVNVNAQHEINGWTALHWAAKRNHLNIVNLLCNHGADKNIPTNKGEVAAQLTGEGVIKVLLNAMKGGGGGGQAAANNQASNGSPAPAKPTVKEEKLAIAPNYIRNPPLAYQVQVPQSDDPGLEAALGSFEHLALDQDDGLRGGDPQLLLLQAHDQDTSQHDNSDKDMIFSAFSSDNIEELSANNKDITSSSFVSENIKDGSSIGMQELNIDYTLSDVKLGDFSASFEYHALMTNTAQALTARNSHVIKTAASFSGYENCIAANKALFLTKESLNVENSNSIVPSAPLNDDPNQPTLRGLGTIPSSYPYYTSSSEYSDLPSDCSADFSNEYLLETSSDSADYFLPFQLQPRQDINSLAHNIPQRSLELSNRNLTHRHTCCDYSGKTISDQMIALTQTKQLDANDRLKIGQLLDYVHGSVNEVFPQASVECFGSCVNGLGSKTSDIDIHVDLDGQYNQDGTVINRNVHK